MSANKYLIELTDVRQAYPSKSGSVNRVLNDIDLRVSEHEFIAVVGPSGCGKSTLLRLILGSEEPVSGSVMMNSLPITSPGRDRGIVFQKYGLFPHLTVLQNIMFGLELERYNLFFHWMQKYLLCPPAIAYVAMKRAYVDMKRGMKKILRSKFLMEISQSLFPNWISFECEEFKQSYRLPMLFAPKSLRDMEDLAMEYMRKVRLQDSDALKYPNQLSGGMQQRVAIAQSLAMKHQVLLMDEPFGALDDSTRPAMQNLILELWEKEKMTVFFVTHDLEEALFVGRRVLGLTQFYSTDEGPGVGSKITFDVEVSEVHPKPQDFKYTPRFAELLKSIRRDVLDPQYLQHMKDFDLQHRDSYRTVDKGEWKKGETNGPS